MRNPSRSWKARGPVGTDEAITREVVGVYPDGRLLIQTEGRPFAELIEPADLEATIDFDTRALASAQKMAAESAKQQVQAATQKAEAQDTDGFAEQFKEPQRSRVIEVLTRQVSVQGTFASRRDHARRLVAEGAIVTLNKPREVILPGGSFFTEKDLTKTMVNYIAWLDVKEKTPVL